MLNRDERRDAALASALAGATMLVCAGVVLMTASCGIRVSAQDFPVLKLAHPNDSPRK